MGRERLENPPAPAISAPREDNMRATLMSEGQTTAPESRSFEADVAKLLQLMVHSVYSDRDVFVRELISNAADA